MPATGGPLESVTLDGRNFSVVGDNDAQRKLGGFENEVSPNGNGTARNIKTPVPWSLSDVAVEIDDDRGDHEFLQALSDRNDYFPISATFASGSTYNGVGTINGELVTSAQSASATMSLAGQGKLTKQS